uniref:Uncharacterized protein n=1 Tax=Arundo donax TaxID=35708 RepID=A0A0A9F7N5_ARUDO
MLLAPSVPILIVSVCYSVFGRAGTHSQMENPSPPTCAEIECDAIRFHSLLQLWLSATLAFIAFALTGFVVRSCG